MEERVGEASPVHKRTCQFGDLPEEILPEIFVHLPPRDFYATVVRVARYGGAYLRDTST
ncbi:hypothetical protein M427DRAFT_33309 [Gonapodya prolifera JEL478]|uniref:F-box domain-containing protein n=1 Tax=Gonapodya prolifera (strain JEL478) TaxID=1344416 RepID=A0A139ABB3_GONPJ|nr:hypothetical protein M427DRAFT_33309 [Gonapodya prolifera JEL478]|eukprot:KXS14096.1 hypothetical protein M427DRAFT_33309 [Gonapodya prolifera JEL478]